MFTVNVSTDSLRSSLSDPGKTIEYCHSLPVNILLSSSQHLINRSKMPISNDPRQQIGNAVHTRASLVTSAAECKRLYGSLWKSKKLNGTVVSVEVSMDSGRRQTSITADWLIQDRIKRHALKLVNMKSGEAPEDVTADVADEQAVQNESPDLQLTDVNTPPIPAIGNNTPIGVEGVSITAHEREWTNREVSLPLNGSTAQRPWKVIGPTGDVLIQGNPKYEMEPYDFFMWMFPQDHLTAITELTNVKLEKGNLLRTTAGEILRFFGVLILMSRFEFSSRRSLWSTESVSKYVPLPQFGKIISRNRFEALCSAITFSHSSDNGDCDSRWSLVSGFVRAINRHRRAHVVPAHTICVDESMSRWYGLGGDWISKGLPHYVAMDRKPENGCEIKTACCGVSGILLGMELVLSASETKKRRYEASLPHGTAVVLRLVEPWFNTNRLVCADSGFASVTAGAVLFRYGLRFTGVVKTATREFPMRFLSSQELSHRGDHLTMVSESSETSPSVMAVLWMDRERRYFVSTTGTTLHSEPIVRSRWRSVGEGAQLVEMEIPVPEVIDTYYKTCSQIDRHNRCRQDDLGLEKKFEVNDWSLRVNTSLLSMCIVDSWLLYKGSMGARNCRSQKDYYAKLADQLIDNSFDAIGLRNQPCSDNDKPANPLAYGTGIYLTPTNKRRKINGNVSKAVHQARCKICKLHKKSKYLCSECLLKGNIEVWLCHSDTGRDCFQRHLQHLHQRET